MTGSTSAATDFAVLGVGVMGSNLALNLADSGLRVAVWDHTPRLMDGLLAAHPEARLAGLRSLPELAASLTRPRRLLIMVTAGGPVDAVLTALRPLLTPGDVILDGGNSWYEDTRRRAADLAASGLAFFGCGVSGGEEGARHGPSLMPGGPASAYPLVRGVLEAIAARTEAGPCVTLVGPDGAGHFVKMVHNGIEYGDMQLIAEAYDILRKTLALPAPAIAEIFARWNEGPLASFLIELTARVLDVRDEATGEPLVDLVLDRAGQKGTGMWTARVALEFGVPVPTIAAAIDARNLSALREERLAASGRLAGPRTGAGDRRGRRRRRQRPARRPAGGPDLRLRPGDAPDRHRLRHARLERRSGGTGAHLEGGMHHPRPDARPDPRRVHPRPRAAQPVAGRRISRPAAQRRSRLAPHRGPGPGARRAGPGARRESCLP